MNIRPFSVLVLLCAAWFCPSHSAAITFTNDATISILNTNYDGLDLVVTNCTLTVNGLHTFSTLLVAAGGKLTHSSNGTGQTTDAFSITNESYILTDTNAVALVNTNVVLASVSVADAGNTILYTNNVDYTLSAEGGGITQLARTTNSSIPDGMNVLVSYNWQNTTAVSGINLAVSGDVVVTAGGIVDAIGKGYSSVSATGRGATAGSPSSGGGGSNGGRGGLGSSNGIGGLTVSQFWQTNSPGGAGGTGAGGNGATGGGLVKIQCGGTFTLDGIIDARGLNATNARSGGGAGGGVLIVTTNFAGAGSIIAKGGAGEPIHGGGGGGGRIEIESATNTFSGTLNAAGGAGWQAGGAGTVFVRQFGTVGQLTLDNGGVVGAGTLLLSSLNGPNLTVQGKALAVFSGGPFTVGELLVRSNSSVLPISTNFSSLYVFTVQSNATIEATAAITASGRGYSANAGNGTPLANSYVGAGAGHGGFGGNASLGGGTNAAGGNAYGSVSNPSFLGSGGRTIGTAIGGMGGGAIYLTVLGNLRADGEISANATAGSGDRSGGGSGGSVWINASALSGTGSISADGAAGGLPFGGGGAGGRIAVFYTTNNFTGTLSAHGGNGFVPGAAGTIYLKAAQANGNLTMDNGGLRGGTTIRDSLTIDNLTVANGAVVSNTISADSFVNLVVGTNAVLFFNYFSATLTVSSNLVIFPGGVISVDGLGSLSSPPGSAGGSHAGVGGRGPTSLGNTGALDSASSPTLSGAAGGYGPGSAGGRGGGLLTVNANGLLQLDGKMTANGLDVATNGAGAGAGGSLRITAAHLAGSGSFSADGGSASPTGGGGGGGCVAVTCTTTNNTFAGTFSAKGGTGYQPGGAGSIYYKRSSTSIHPSILVDNGGLGGTNTAFNASSAGIVDLTIQGGASVTAWNGPAFANLIVRSNSWFGANVSLSVISNVTVEAGGGIRLDGISTSGSGAGNVTTRGGAGHGGIGGGNPSGYGVAYDSIVSPSSSGALGGGNISSAPVAGKGGGFLQMNVQGLMQVDGRVSADGTDGEAGAGGGSGGTVRLVLNKFAGHGSISAHGGAGVPAAGLGGGGGGGRISVTWNPSFVGNGPSNLFTGTFSAHGGTGVIPGGAGTIYLRRNDQSSSVVLVDNGGLTGPTNTPVGTAFGAPTATWNLSILGGASVCQVPTIAGLSNLLVGAGSQLTAAFGSSSVALSVLDGVTVQPGGAIMVDGKGFGRGGGVAGGAGGALASKGAGGGYGGVGGASASNAKGGTNYGSATQPVDLGSGGGPGVNDYVNGCEGGGAIKLVVPGTLTLDGLLSANGNAGLQDDSGGGAGGSIWVMAKNIAGTGVIAADGGDGELYGGGGGGGGRIAIYAKTTNAFTGSLSALGGDGANAGQNGTVVFTTNLFPFSIVSYSPSGVTGNTVGSVAFNFNQLVDPATVTPSTFTLTMPTNYTGPQPALIASASAGSSSAGPTFPAPLNVPGDYTVTVAPTITDIFGTPLSQAYTNAFTVVIPTVEGYVRTTNGVGVAGVTVQTSGYLPTSTDATGNYILGVPPGWTGIIAPSLGANMFLPGSITLTNVTAQTTNQNFVMVSTILPEVSSGVSGTNLLFNWTGFSSVTYQLYNSSNLVDWLPWGDPVPGTNAPMQLPIPIGTDAQSFFRLGASN